MTKVKLPIPNEVAYVAADLQSAGYEAYFVGGCVRDLLLNREPSDWDVTTNATPEQIQAVFEHTFYENDFGTVGVVNDEITDKNPEKQHLKVVEVTPYRLESAYSDNRHPDAVQFSQDLSDDLQRRDFTINALCYNPQDGEIVDMFGGIADLQAQTIRAVGDARKRFDEDALRILRAVRFSAQLDFSVSNETAEAILELGFHMKNVSRERIQVEFVKIINSNKPMHGLVLAKDLNILQYIIPELLEADQIEQNGQHRYDVLEHLLRTMQHAADKQWSFEIRLAGLLHDIGKPPTRRFDKEKNDYTFYGHEVVGAKIAKKILKDLKFSHETIEKVTRLVRWHMFFSDPDQITLSAVRRIIRNVGGSAEVWDLIKLRICDRIGMGRPKERPYRLRQYEAMMDEAMRSPVSVRDLKINGDILIAELHMKPGRRMGDLLHALMSFTLDTPENNNREFLMAKVQELDALSDEDLKAVAEKGKEKIETAEEAELKAIRKKHKV